MDSVCFAVEISRDNLWNFLVEALDHQQPDEFTEDECSTISSAFAPTESVRQIEILIAKSRSSYEH